MKHILLFFFLLPLALLSKAQDSVRLIAPQEMERLADSLAVLTPEAAMASSSDELRPLNPSLQTTPFRRFCDTLSMSWTALSALVLPGAGQVINGDYWKLPLVWGSIGGFTYGGVYFNRRLNALSNEPLLTDAALRLEQESRLTEMRYLRKQIGRAHV